MGEMAVSEVFENWYIDIETFKCITNDITTDEVIITEERIQHIKEIHNNDFFEIQPYIQDVLSMPDYILADSKRENTGLILKQITENNGLKVQVVLRVHTSKDRKGLKNSIISAWKISDSRWNNYLRNKKILYKSK